MDQKKEDDKKPAIPIPTLKDSKNAPQLKIKGLAQGGLSLLERLKQFKKKDLAFILAGLGVLFLAPLAEHFMMAPEGDNGSLTGGFGGRGDGSGIFGKGGSPYEPGVNGLAPGGLAGGGSDVITPLNVRDPAALVMGPGATQQPPTASTPAPAAPPSKSDNNDWKDALAQSAAKAAGAAVPKAALPVPKIPLSAGGLRGLGAVSGGGGGSYSLPGISAANVPNRGNVGSSPSPTGGSGIRGVSRGDTSGGNPSNLDALKKAAQNAANVFNGPGSASSNLETAAKTQFGDGSAGGGAGDGGNSPDKAAGQSGDKGSKNADGQSLAFLKAKQEQEKAIEFEWKKKEAGDLDLMWYKLRDKMAEEAIMTPFKAITGMIAKQITNFGTGSGSTVYCVPHGNAGVTGLFPVTASQIGLCGAVQAPNTDGSQTGNVNYCGLPAANGTDPQTNNLWYCSSSSCGSNPPQFDCNGAGDGTKQTPPQQPYVSQGGPAPSSPAQMGQLCQAFQSSNGNNGSQAASATSVGASAAGGSGQAYSQMTLQLQTAGANLIAAQVALEQGNGVAVGNNNQCNNPSAGINVPFVSMNPNTKLIDQLGGNANTVDGSTYKQLLTAFNNINAAYTRDSNSLGKILGAQPDGSQSPLITDTKKVRDYFTAVQKQPDPGDVSTQAQAAVTGSADIASIYNAINGAPAAGSDGKSQPGPYDQGNATDQGLNVDNPTLLKNAGTQLGLIKGYLQQVGNYMQAANTAIGNANGLSGQVQSVGGGSQYMTSFTQQQQALQAEYQQAVGEYNRQNGGSTGLLPQLNQIQPLNQPQGGLPAANTAHVTDVVGQGASLKSFSTAMTGVTGGGGTNDAPTPNGTLATGKDKPDAATFAKVQVAGDTYKAFIDKKAAGTNADTASSPYLVPHVNDAKQLQPFKAQVDAANTTLTQTPGPDTSLK